jgi:hypothetical protein
MGETLSSPTISMKPQRIVKGSKCMSEEPYASIGHVRVCGGPGGQPPGLPGSGSWQKAATPGEPCVLAPGQVRHILRGGSPRRVRVSHPPVPSVAPVAELIGEVPSEQDR